MSAPFHKICSKLERAAVAYLIAQGAGVSADTVPGKQSANKPLPITICWAKHWEVDPPHSREFLCDLTISVKTSAPLDVRQLTNDQVAASNARLGAVFGSFTEPDPNNATDIPDAITAAARAKAAADALLAPVGPDVDLADFTCLNIAGQSGDADSNEKGDVWVDSMDLKVRCSPYAV